MQLGYATRRMPRYTPVVARNGYFQRKKFLMNDLAEISVDTAMNQTGDQTSDQIGQRLDVRRRLIDKIPAAFNYAYSVGEYEISQTA